MDEDAAELCDALTGSGQPGVISVSSIVDEVALTLVVNVSI